MSLKIARETLFKPLQQVSGVVEKRQTLPILSNLLFVWNEQQLSMTGTDLELEVVARTAVTATEAGEATLPARKLLDICRALPDGAEIELKMDADRAVLRAGRARFTLATLPAGDYPSVEGVVQTQQFSVPSALLKRLIEKTHFSMAQQDVRYYLNGLMMELSPGTIRCVATDGHRLALCETQADLGDLEYLQVILPRKGVTELLRGVEKNLLPKLLGIREQE